MIRLKKLPREEAKKIITDIDNYSDVEFDDLVSHWKNYDPVSEYDDSYEDFRKDLIDTFKAALEESGGKMSYILDLRVGLKLYSLLPIGKDFTVTQANDDDIWRYISVKVMPDITYLRYPDPEKAVADSDGRLNHKRFYAATRRIWLKTLWWYVYLSWQGNEEATFTVLKDNSVDNINKLIETPGRGYRLNLYRTMMSEYARTGPHTSKEFAAITKMNNAKCVLIEPALTEGAEKGYVHRLIAEWKMGSEILKKGAENGAERRNP